MGCVVPQKKTGILEYWNTTNTSIHLKSRNTMKYNISKSSAPKMPDLGRGTESIKIPPSKVPKGVREPLVPMLFPIIYAHENDAGFQYPALIWKEMCGQMANPVADSGGNKGQFSNIVEALFRDLCERTWATLGTGRCLTRKSLTPILGRITCLRGRKA